MEPTIITNPVPTPEEMGRILGLSPEHVASIRRIMSEPTSRRSAKRATRSSARKPGRSRNSSRRSGRR